MISSSVFPVVDPNLFKGKDDDHAVKALRMDRFFIGTTKVGAETLFLKLIIYVAREAYFTLACSS